MTEKGILVGLLMTRRDRLCPCFGHDKVSSMGMDERTTRSREARLEMQSSGSLEG